jgi:hypothetical protein
MRRRAMRIIRRLCGWRNDSVRCEPEGRKVSGTSPSATISSTEVLTEERTVNEAMTTASKSATQVLRQKRTMNEAIVPAAGKVWKHLNDNGATSLSQLRGKTGLSTEMVNRAIGWLAREDKLCFETENGSEQIRLR